MLKNSTVQVNTLEDIIRMNPDSRNTSFLPFNNGLFNNAKRTKSDIEITSIAISEYKSDDDLEHTSDYDDYLTFKIEGKTSVSQYSWEIYKNNKQIRELFEKLSKRDYPDEHIIKRLKRVKNYSNKEILKYQNNISEYLIYVFNSTFPNQPEELKEAFRISKTSFSDNTKIKPFEGYAYKKADPRILRSIIKYCLFPIEYFFFNEWNYRWIILKNDMISYLNNPNTLIGKNVYWLDDDTEIFTKKEKILIIKTRSRSLALKFESKFERDLWQKEIYNKIEKKEEEILNNVYHSFTSQKTNCGAKWFVDAHDYFNYLFEQLKNAKESVYITDWFMSPELALKRPINYDNFKNGKIDTKNLNFSNVSRLMDILYLLAKKGVQIYILLFCEVSLALAINSKYTKTVLKKIINNDNIKITRHPKGTSSILWSHHEKLVIIDQKIAFVGGLDLCW